MKFVRAGKGYINYGLIPKNEYAADNAEKTIVDDAACKQRLQKQQAWHSSVRRNIRGSTRLWKVNGWRAEVASQDAELAGMESYSDYAYQNNRSL